MLRMGVATARRATGWLALVIVILLAPLALAPPAAAAPGERCFAQTGQCVSGRFLAYWDTNGGLARNGYPLTSERREVLEDGKEYTVQYFERVRMEYHPENVAPYDVLLGQFGREVFRETFQHRNDLYDIASRPAAPQPGLTFFPETGHNVAPDFFAYWQANGGLAQFGYPLAEEQDRPDPFIAPPLRVQYFERGRIEAHPENAPPYDILLGQFGRQVLAWRDTPLAPPLAALYRGDPALRELLGPPVAGVYAGMVDVLAFERGLLLVTNGGKANPDSYGISAFCPSLDFGPYGISPRSFRPTGDTIIVMPGTSLPAGGPGPRPGTSIPGGIAGLVWEKGSYRDCLGYATAATTTAQPLVVQSFGRGTVLILPDRGEAYALYRREGGDSPGYYRRYRLPKE